MDQFSQSLWRIVLSDSLISHISGMLNIKATRFVIKGRTQKNYRDNTKKFLVDLKQTTEISKTKTPTKHVQNKSENFHFTRTQIVQDIVRTSIFNPY